jgi:acyl carrier protein
MDLREEILEKIIGRAAEIFQKDPDELDAETKFLEDLQAKSVNFVQIIALLEDEYDAEINFMAFRKNKTFGEAAEFVAEIIQELLQLDQRL